MLLKGREQFIFMVDLTFLSPRQVSAAFAVLLLLLDEIEKKTRLDLRY